VDAWKETVVMDLIAPVALLTDTLNRCRREEIRTEVYDPLDYLESRTKWPFDQFRRAIGQRQLREARAESQREFGKHCEAKLIDNGLV
jgi:hypothetical protein